MSFSKENRSHTLNGIVFVALFASSSLYLGELPWIANMGISCLVIAIILGIFYGNTLRYQLPPKWTPGIQFSAKYVLRLAIILYGFRISFQQMISVGATGFALDIAVVGLTLLFGTFVGVKILKMDRHIALLISTGAAICGAAAVLAAEEVLKSEPYKAAIAVGTAVLFGMTAMFIYPALQHAGILGLSNHQFGLFAGASIHEVAQVVVAGVNVSPESGSIAVIVKMMRVLLLVPTLIFLSFYEYRLSKLRTSRHPLANVPWFAVFFVMMIGINSLHILPASFVILMNKGDLFLLTMAMAAIGMETNLIKIKKVGLAPLYLASILFVWLTVGVYLLVKFVL